MLGLPFNLLSAQVEPEQGPTVQTIRLFMDCQALACFDMDYLRQEIPFVNWVRDLQDSNVYLLITAQGTGAGGISSELIFQGREDLAGMADSLTYVSLPNSSTDEQRGGLVRILKIGLTRYVGMTPMREELEIGLRARGPAGGPGGGGPGGRPGPTLAPEEDPWDFWVFSVTGRGSLSGETTRTSKSFNGSFSANRVTEAWKASFRLSSSYSDTDYETQGIPIYIRRDHTFSGTLVKSLAARWSAGLRISARNSTYYNFDFAGSVAPVLEFSFFPYKESTRRGISLQYAIEGAYNDYREETVYFKTEEAILAQSLSLGVGFTQPWGTAYGSVEAGHQIDDLDKHHASVFGGLNLRLSRGLSLTFTGSYSRVHDRISVAAIAGSTPEDVLLRRRQLQTDYTYSTSIGLTYRFGSIFNNVVNPRLDGPGGGGIIMIM
jgi:hypothetical protein